ncbi:MAG: hypothetical protein SNH35_07335 [Rikenellaceae bacterium]
MKKEIITLMMVATVMSVSSQSKVFYVELKDDVAITESPVLEYKQNVSFTEPTKGAVLTLFPEMKFQIIDGIGGTFNEIGGVALMALPQDEREKVMSNLFSESGANFSLCRTAVGSSDFGVDDYSYSEVANDYKMKHFSIDRERSSMIPYMQIALKYNPSMQLFASPWSPPAWMKYSGEMDKGDVMRDKNFLIDDPEIYKAYALYFSKYIEHYAKEGITVDRLLIQNENDIHTKYPSCVVPIDQMYEFISKYLRPQFEKDNIETEIWAGTFRTSGVLDGVEFVKNKKYLAAVEGVGIQYSTSDHISDMKYFAPEAKIMHTECKCYNRKNSNVQAFSRLEEIASYINYGVTNFVYWNMILNETGRSGWEWKQNSLINIDRETKKVTYNPDYAVMSLFSKFIRPGSVRIGSHTREEAITVMSGDNIYIFVKNDGKEVRNYDCRDRATKVIAKASVPAESIAVIVIPSSLAQ